MNCSSSIRVKIGSRQLRNTTRAVTGRTAWEIAAERFLEMELLVRLAQCIERNVMRVSAGLCGANVA